MPFTITKVAKHSSNKPQTLVVISVPKPIQPAHKSTGPTPFIDKISITLKVPTEQAGQDMWSAHWNAVADQQTYVPQGTKKGYARTYRIALSSVTNSKAWPLYQIGWDDNCISKLRIEFVPVDLGPVGMEELHVALFALMDGGWGFVVEHVKRPGFSGGGFI